MNYWLLALLIWCGLWWLYAAIRLWTPWPGELVFREGAHPLLTLIVWAVLVLTAPLWCPLGLLAQYRKY